MSLLTTVNEASPGQPYAPDVGNLPYGVRYNLTWNPVLAAPTPTLSTIIGVPGLTNNAPVSATVQLGARGSQNIVDAWNCRLLASYVESQSIYIWITANGSGANGQPLDNSNYGISWSVTGD